MNLGARQTLMGDAIPYDSQIEYLESSQMEQWFDTGIYFTNNKVEITCALKRPYSNTEFNWWGTNTYGSHNPNIWTYSYRISMGDLTKWMDYASNQLSLNTKYTITYDVPSKSLYLNGEKIQSIDGDFSTYKSQNTIKIGKRDGDVIRGFGILYAFQILKDDTLIQDLIPVRVGNVGYMYDKVSKQLFGNQGTGNFVLGPDI